MDIEAFTEALANDLNEDPEELRERAESVEIEPPWNAEIECTND